MENQKQSKEKELSISEKILDQEFKDSGIKKVWIDESKEVVLSAMDKYLENSHNDYKDKYLRLYAEFDNYKKRNNKQKIQLEVQTKFNVSKSLIDIIDDIELSKGKFDERSITDWSKGVFLIFDNFKSKLNSMGIEKVECNIGDKFDPNIHEAISIIDNKDYDHGRIVDIVKNGYSINETIVRYPKVIVSK